MSSDWERSVLKCISYVFLWLFLFFIRRSLHCFDEIFCFLSLFFVLSVVKYFPFPHIIKYVILNIIPIIDCYDNKKLLFFQFIIFVYFYVSSWSINLAKKKIVALTLSSTHVYIYIYIYIYIYLFIYLYLFIMCACVYVNF